MVANRADRMRRKTEPEDDARLPIKLDAATNGEYEPRPQPEVDRVRAIALERADANARRVGLDRRTFLRSSCGVATSLLTMNELGCGGGGYALPREATHEPQAAAKVVEGDELVFDVQVHHVSTQRRWWDSERPTLADFLKTTPRASCGTDGHWSSCFSSDVLFKEVFLDSDTDIAVLSALWGTEEMNAIVVEEMASTRERMAKLAGSPRLLIHGAVRPKTEPREATLAAMHAMVESWKIAAWKLYPVWSDDGKGYRLDDEETGLWAIREGVRMGIPIFAVHKGLPLPGATNAFTSAIDVGPAAHAVKDATILVYHAGYHPDHAEGAYDPDGEYGVDTLIRGLKLHGIGSTGNVYAELGSTWRELMKKPDQAAHVLGKLLMHLGEDRILWGTDAIWYGSPQDQIQAFRAFQISPAFRDMYGYPQLTPAIKAKILGLNAARVYGVDVPAAKAKMARDAVSQTRAEYANEPSPSFTTYGPRTRRELGDLLRAERGQ